MMNLSHAFDVSSLGYLLIQSDKLDSWKDFAVPSLGMQAVETSNRAVAFRMDDQAQRIIISDGPRAPRYTMGWQAASKDAIDRIGTRLEDAGIPVAQGDSATASERMVGDLISFLDPAGNGVEIFTDPVLLDTPFVPGRTHSGFRTGSLGFGHIALKTGRIEQMLGFYRDILGFGLSDYQLSPFHAYFLHVNQRHHSLALIEMDQEEIHHVMIEHTMLDDVGQAIDVVKANNHEIGVTLGRHSNDFMTSFYVQSPSPFLIECGWGGLEIDPQNHKSVELTQGPSLWGHDRSWMTPEQFAEADRLRRKAGQDGLRAPVNVLPDRYKVCSPS